MFEETALKPNAHIVRMTRLVTANSGLEGMDNREAFDLSENLGLIIFVDVESLPDIGDDDEQQ